MKMRHYSHSILFMVVFMCITLTGCEKEAENTLPTASFNISPEIGTPATEFTFDATSCSDSEDPTASLLVRWDWNTDGIFETDFSTNKIISHKFSDPGIFQVTLEVKDSKQLGCSITKALTIEGKIPDIVTDTVSNIEPFSALCGGEVIDDFGLDVTTRGLCWSTNANPTTSDSVTTNGTGIGKFESPLTGLLKNTKYYIRAYASNSIGTAYGNQVEFTTLYVWSCGDSITINHTIGDVAPVDKTVTYHTTTNIPGEETKCWITQNLGADHQAEAVNDATEASAGWYWQFNRMQGYLHDGTNRIPNSTWNYIDEYTEWDTKNDPCHIELGEGWHIPTESELTNIHNIGNWTNWNDLWNSGLKLHAGGYLNYINGELQDRGIYGSSWSTSQSTNTKGWLLTFGLNTCYMSSNFKSFGLNMRCVKD